MNATKKTRESQFTDKQISAWKKRYDEPLVDAFVDFFDLQALDNAVDLLLSDLVNGNAFDRGFLNADLQRRRYETQMVGAEVRIFNATADLMEQSVGMRGQLGNNLGSNSAIEAMDAVNSGIGNAADLIAALAKKNETMGEGVPSGGTTTGPGPEETTTPPEQPPTVGTPKPPCYEAYRKRIEELWDQKEQMGDSIMWWLQWADALKDLTFCAGPAAVKLLLELIGAAKK